MILDGAWILSKTTDFIVQLSVESKDNGELEGEAE